MNSMHNEAVRRAQALLKQGRTLVYLVRHGETSWNAERRFQGQLDVPLSEAGVAQAEALAAWLVEQPIEFKAIYASDLQRALGTAKIIGSRLEIRPQTDPNLREIHVGDWQGLLASEIEARYPGKLSEWSRTVDRFVVPGGESVPRVQRRVLQVYRRIVSDHSGEAVIVVSHGAALASLITAIRDWDLLETWESKAARMSNTGVTVIAVDPGSDQHDVLAHNLSDHLEGTPEIASVLDGARRQEV